MQCIQKDNILEIIEDESATELSPVADIFGEPEVLPRIGDQYQAEIPSLIAACDWLQLINEPADSEVVANLRQSFPLGLPIPVMWENCQCENFSRTAECENRKKIQITSNNEDSKLDMESLATVLADDKSLDKNSVLQATIKSDSMDQEERGLCLFPGSLGESWSDIECDSFLLGLYIFGKNLILVKRFVESKEMGDILSFYYGKFHRTFGEGRVSFEEYIFTLKDTVGINVLIEAVGIGKGKQDLTGKATEPIKTNHVFSLRPEIPIGKACSSLSSADIIKYLRGDFRLSKARSSDLFWEAVWPRLLAKGWHSEQPKDHGVCGSKPSLVFLIPGVKKFSRRRLAKGNQYFDSVSDVLNKVASDPGLLELEIEAAESSEHKEDKWEPPEKQDFDGLSKKQRHCYLQPHNSNRNQNLMKFTIVDTSMVHGIEQPKVRELRSLPVQTTSLSASSSLSCETEQDTSEESNPAADTTEREASVDSSDRASVLDALDPTITGMENHESSNTSLLSDNLQGNSMKHHFSVKVFQKINSSCSEYLAPVKKHQGFNVCNNGESSHSIENISTERKQNEDQSHCQSTLPYACPDLAFQTDPQNLSSDGSLAKGSPEGSNAASDTENCLGREESPGNPQPRILIDLNLPHVSPDIGTEEPFTMDMVQHNDNSCANELSSLLKTSHQPEPSNISDGGTSTVQLSTMNSQRQSMRSRPLTTKAWEALEYGFFDTKRKRKRGEASQNNSTSRSSRQVRGRTALSSTVDDSAGNGILETKIEENLVEVCSSKVNVVGESQL
uniref:SANT domain-containing protein n=1 Tax=Fagus sylvatica TaxID=28930 RepID=A0A2N9EC62_FAGSY